MTFFLLQTYPIPQSSKISSLSRSFKPHNNPIFTKTKTTPARDRIIDFGRHKGKMLGTLPSNYLKWVAKNLRARDFEDWAKLADQVLEDPVYLDRIEWEFAESVLIGNGHGISNLSERDESAVSQLLELSERFGWDNEDKVGWSKIDFEVLGTSKGGRIPRIVGDGNGGNEEKEKVMVRMKEEHQKVGGLSETEDRRRERRRRVKKKIEIVDNRMAKFENGNSSGEGKSQNDQDLNMENQNPFPGREALLKKLLKSKRFL